jgi:hypothetical protein
MRHDEPEGVLVLSRRLGHAPKWAELPRPADRRG